MLTFSNCLERSTKSPLVKKISVVAVTRDFSKNVSFRPFNLTGIRPRSAVEKATVI